MENIREWFLYWKSDQLIFLQKTLHTKTLIIYDDEKEKESRDSKEEEEDASSRNDSP